MSNFSAVAESSGQCTMTVTTTLGLQNVITGPGRLCAILLVSAPGGIITVYDSTGAASGTVIAYVPVSAVAGAFQAYDIPYANGITFNQSGDQTILTLVYTVG